MARPSIFCIACLFFHSLSSAQPLLSLASATASPGSNIALNLSLSSPAGSEPSGLQWTIIYTPAGLTNVNVAPGAALTSTGKTLQCAAAAGSSTCIAYGMNSNIVPNGVVAVLTATLPSSPGNIDVALTSPIGATAGGGSEGITGSGGSIADQLSSAISSLICKPQSVSAGSASACMVNLTSAAGASGVVVALSSSSTSLSVPASVTIQAKATSANFTCIAGEVLSAQSAVVTASLGTSSAFAKISINPSATSSQLLIIRLLQQPPICCG